jgi:outer membrane lipopolysaccharide assembly protein LptE/RlpB
MLKTFALIVVLMISGCGYTIQSRSDLPFSDASIGRIGNMTSEPKLQDIMARTLSEVLMEYGFRVRADAPYRIEGDITRFDLRILSEKALTATEYEVVIEGSFRVIDIQKGSVTTLSEMKSPFVTSFNSGGRIESVIALKELAIATGLRNLSQELVEKILAQKETGR